MAREHADYIHRSISRFRLCAAQQASLEQVGRQLRASIRHSDPWCPGGAPYSRFQLKFPQTKSQCPRPAHPSLPSNGLHRTVCLLHACSHTLVPSPYFTCAPYITLLTYLTYLPLHPLPSCLTRHCDLRAVTDSRRSQPNRSRFKG